MAESSFALPTGATASRSALGLATSDSPTFAGLISSGTAGYDASPGSDIDTDLITVNVTGTPRIFWDESQDKFSSTKGWEISGPVTPVANDGGALGTSALQFSDLFLAEGGVINWDNGDATLTQSGNTLTLAGATLILPAPTATEAPLKIGTGGTLLTTAEDGAIEMDDNCFYGTVDAGNRGYIPVVHFIRQDSTYTLANSGTAQKLFNSSTNGEITLETGAYRFEGLVALTSMSATSGNATFSLAGTATLAAILWYGFGRDAAADATTGTISGSYSADATLVTAPLITAATTTAMFAYLKGTFEVTGAGTVIPSITLQTAVGTAVVSIGSYFEVWRVGSTSSTTVGQWT